MRHKLRSLRELSSLLSERAAASDVTLRHVAEATLATAKLSVQGVFGRTPPLAALADTTVERKEQLGAPDPEAALVLTGGYRASWQTSIDVVRPGYIGGTLYTDDEVAAMQEFGTAYMPPRPVVAEGLAEAAPAVSAIAMAGTVEIMTGKPSPILRLETAEPPLVTNLGRK